MPLSPCRAIGFFPPFRPVQYTAYLPAPSRFLRAHGLGGSPKSLGFRGQDHQGASCEVRRLGKSIAVYLCVGEELPSLCPCRQPWISEKHRVLRWCLSRVTLPWKRHLRTTTRGLCFRDIHGSGRRSLAKPHRNVNDLLRHGGREGPPTVRSGLAAGTASTDRAVPSPGRSCQLSGNARGVGPYRVGIGLQGRPTAGDRCPVPHAALPPRRRLPGPVCPLEPGRQRAPLAAPGIPRAPGLWRAACAGRVLRPLPAARRHRAGARGFPSRGSRPGERLPAGPGLRDAGLTGPRWHGRRLQGLASRTEAAGGAENDLGRRPCRARRTGTLPGGGRSGGPAATRPYRADL